MSLRASRIKALSLEPGAPPDGYLVFTFAIQEEDEARGFLEGQEVRENEPGSEGFPWVLP